MNLRMDENGFRFRITPSDLGELLAGKGIEYSLRIGGHRFGCRISPVDACDSMTLEMAVGGLCLHAPRAALENLKTMGRSKNGMSVTQDGIVVSLQIDIKLQARKAA